MVEGEVRLVLEIWLNTSNVINYGIKPGIYTFKDLSEVLTREFQLGFDGFNSSIDIEFFDYSMKTKLVVGPNFIAVEFAKELFFSNILDFNPHWDNKQYNEYNSHKVKNLSTKKKFHWSVMLLTVV